MFPSKVLVPVDGSPASLRAVDLAIKMVMQTPGSSIVLLHVQGIMATGIDVAFSVPSMGAPSEVSSEALKDAIAKCESACIHFVTLVKSGKAPKGTMAQQESVGHIAMGAGEAAEAITQTAREEDVELIVMGTRAGNSSPMAGLLLGSVAMQVINLAEVPITLVK